jgi:hypothetical protein
MATQPASAESASPTRHDEEPDPRVLWRWAGRAVRPWLGWALIAVGALLILIGWFGVSREAIVGKQIPYLVSGGIGGVFFAVLGAYFLATEELRSDSGRLDRLERMVDELHQVLLTRPDAPRIAPSSNGSSASHSPARRVVVVDGGESFHRAECALATGKQGEELTPAAARKRGLLPCRVCEPAPATAAS